MILQNITKLHITYYIKHFACAQKERDNSEESVYSVSTTVKAKKVGQWYSSSNAVACLMDTGCFACVEDKV